MSALQMTLFPEATDQEIEAAKKLLTGYRRMKCAIAELEKLPVMTEKQRIAYNEYLVKTSSLEMAVNLVMNPDIKRILEHRFIRGEQHKQTLIYFAYYHQTTIDRKIKRGIKMVADNILMLE